MLPLTRSQLRNLALSAGIILLIAIVVRALSSRSELEASGNPARPAATTILASCYSGPEATNDPSPGETSTSPARLISYDFIATPLPGERLVAGPIVEIPKPKDTLPYTYREDYIIKDGNALDRTFVQYQGQEIRLGDDAGDSNAEVGNDKYLVWWYHANGDETNLPLKSGLYVYEIRTGHLTRIADGRGYGFSKLEGEWIVHHYWENPYTGNPPRNDTPAYVQPLFAYNIATGQTITLTTGVPDILGRGPGSFYGLSGNRAGWVEYDMQTQQYAIKVCDLNSGQLRSLNVPDLTHPLSFSLSDDLVVWRDPYWHGYSLTQDALFTIPHAPPGWEGNYGGMEVTARHSALEWKIRISDTETHYFRAPVIPRGQGVTAWESFVIGRRPPMPTPTPLPPPTAYP